MLDLSTSTDATPDRSPDLTGHADGDLDALIRRVRQEGFAFADAASVRRLVEDAGGRDWQGFAASWEDLELDRFMADGGTYRKRRFGCFAVAGDAIREKPPQPHVQALEFNPLNGGVERRFAPVLEPIAAHPINRALVGICRRLFEAALPAGVPAGGWHVEMHQFRIEARPDAAGQPTPEGLHRDGVDGVLVLMVRRENVEGGESTIADAGRRPLSRATLAEPFDACFVDDHRVFHGVGAVRPLDPSRAAFRDVLVLTFRTEKG